MTLLQAGDNIKATPLHWVCQNGNAEVLKVLLDAVEGVGAHTHVDTHMDGNTDAR